MADHESVASDKFFILLEKSSGYILEPHVFKAPTKVWKEELQRGTILEEQPSKDPHEKTFVVADRKEVHFDCEVIRLAGNLEKLTNVATKQLLRVTSPEIRYQSYLQQRRRVAEQRQEEEGKRLKENWVVLEEELNLVKQDKEEVDRRVVTLERELRDKEERNKELERKLSAVQQKLDEYEMKEPRDWVISRDEIHITDTRLGVGAWGEVVLGRFRGSKVAVKQIHELIISPHNRRLFEREMKIASRCRHPCMLQFIGATNDEGSPLFVTELMESSLRALLKQQPPLSCTDISVIALDVAQALNYLHKSEPPIIHRDISSANVLLWRQGDHWRGKVSDYGTANFIRKNMTVGPGAVNYSSPEASTGHQTTKMDVYSFGVLLCEMCIQELPDRERREEQVAQVTDDVFLDLIGGCIKEDPKERPDMEYIIDYLDQQ